MPSKRNKKIVRVQKSVQTVEVANVAVTACVKKLNAVAEEGLKGWLKIGQIIADFIVELKSNPEFKGDAYRVLARHPSSLHKSSMLRQYHAAWATYNKYSGDKDKYPNLCLTHYCLLLPASINLGDRERLLQKASDEDLSISELKQEIAKLRSPKKVQKRTWDGECKRTASLAGRLFSYLSSLHEMKFKMDPQPELSKDLAESLTVLRKFLADHFVQDSNRLESASGNDEAVNV